MTGWEYNITDLFAEYVRTGGWLLLPLLLSAFGIWYIYVVLLVRLKKALKTVDIEHLLTALGDKPALSNTTALSNRRLSLKETDTVTLSRAVQRLSENQGVTPRMVRRVIMRINRGIGFREAFRQCREGELEPYQYAFYVLGALVSTAPLLGLLGTVFGMIDTFAAFSGHSSPTGQQTQQIAAGISKALVTTQAGLIAALPGTMGLAHLYRLYQRLKNLVDRCESHLALALSGK